MYKLIGYILFIILLMSCNSQTKKTENQEPIRTPKSINIEKDINTKIKPKIKESQFRLVIKEGNVSIEQLDSTKIILPNEFILNLESTISICKSCFSFSMNLDTLINVNLETEGKFAFGELIDMNFDELLDIKLPGEGSCCSGSNVFYEIWIYNEEQNNFIMHSELSSKAIWGMNTENKTITTGWHMSAYHYGTQIYTFQNRTMKLIEESETKFFNDTLVKTISKKLVDDHWKIDSLIHTK